MYAAGDAGVVELTSKIVDKEGLRGLLRGWSAAYVRLGKSNRLVSSLSYLEETSVDEWSGGMDGWIKPSASTVKAVGNSIESINNQPIVVV